MKSYKIGILIYMSVLVFALSAFATEASAQSSDMSDRESITLSSKKWVDTYNSNNWKELATLFTEDATMMPPNSPAVVGRKAIAKWQAENESGFRIAFDIQDINVSDNTAYVRGRSCVRIPIGPGEYGVDLGKFVEVRKQQANGEWLIHTDIFNSDGAVGSALLQSCPFAVFE